MADDKQLESMRFELVPKIITEEQFWRNYFYRVSLICQASDLGTLGQESESEGTLHCVACRCARMASFAGPPRSAGARASMCLSLFVCVYIRFNSTRVFVVESLVLEPMYKTVFHTNPVLPSTAHIPFILVSTPRFSFVDFCVYCFRFNVILILLSPPRPRPRPPRRLHANCRRSLVRRSQ